MKTSELSGALLDYWVAKALGYEAEIIADEEGPYVVRTKRFANNVLTRGPFFPSTQWFDGGPIIEREGISVETGYLLHGVEWRAVVGDTFGGNWPTDKDDYRGPTPLIAAMRAYVASKFGESVPDSAEL